MLPFRPSEDVETETYTGFSLPARPPKRRCRKRTVYSVEQREALESFFENNHYPCYDERETLAARLNLQENQVQVWFMNRRAKHSRLQRATGTRQRSPKARSALQDPEVCTSVPAPAPAPAPATTTAGPGCPGDPVSASDPGVAGDPVLPSGPGFAEDLELPWDLLLSEDPMFSEGSVLPGDAGSDEPFRGVAAAEPSASSHLQAQREPPQDAQSPVPAAPAVPPAPAAVRIWTEDSNAGDFWSYLDLIDLPSL